MRLHISDGRWRLRKLCLLWPKEEPEYRLKPRRPQVIYSTNRRSGFPFTEFKRKIPEGEIVAWNENLLNRSFTEFTMHGGKHQIIAFDSIWIEWFTPLEHYISAARNASVLQRVR